MGITKGYQHACMHKQIWHKFRTEFVTRNYDCRTHLQQVMSVQIYSVAALRRSRISGSFRKASLNSECLELAYTNARSQVDELYTKMAALTPSQTIVLIRYRKAYLCEYHTLFSLDRDSEVDFVHMILQYSHKRISICLGFKTSTMSWQVEVSWAYHSQY